jgi:hypothetical protein
VDELDARDFRRLQLAAECGGAIGLLLRPAQRRGQPTWADVQWEVTATRRVGPASPRRTSAGPPISSVMKGGPAALSHPTWRLQVELVRCRGGAGGQTVLLELDPADAIWREATSHATHSLPVPAELADPVRPRRTRRA